MTCEKCQDLCVHRPIRSPSDLRRAITIARESLNDGTLLEMEGRNPLGLPAFQTLLPEGPWNDIVAYQFKCTTCGEVFSLHAETYHGQGGAWEPERKAAIREPL